MSSKNQWYMNFQDLNKIEPAKVYLDIAFRAGRSLQKSKIKDKFKFMKTSAFASIETASRSLTSNLENILKKFPVIDELPEFYVELIRTTLDYRHLKKSLGAVRWALQSITRLQRDYLLKIKKDINIKYINMNKKEFYGRVSSVLKQIDKELAYIDTARITMKRFPNVKTSRFTAAIAGYPNVGKSSILKGLTQSTPEIKEYAFTTKDLNIGYMDKIQLIDTPGTLDREKMNPIEHQAYLVQKLVCNTIILVIDPTETCGYSTKKQMQLAKKIRDFKKPVIIVHNKLDLNQEPDEKFLNVSAKVGTNMSSLKKLIKDHESDSKKKDDSK